jgi:hypothetical protein
MSWTRFYSKGEILYFEASKFYFPLTYSLRVLRSLPRGKEGFVPLVQKGSLFNLVEKANLMYNLFLVYLSISVCFGRLCAHH